MVLGDCYAFSSENGIMANNAIKVSGVTLLEQMANLDDKENARQAFGLWIYLIYMETKKTEKKDIVVHDFYSVYSREEVSKIDERIMKAQKEYDARMRQAIATDKDFIISH